LERTVNGRRAYLGLALLLAAFAVVPLLAPGYFLGAHDAPHSLFFLVQFDQAIADGALVPRWGPDHALGYGYPTFVFYSPLAYYLAEAFHLAGLGIAAAVKATFALSLLASCVGMFLLAESMVGPAGGAIAALVYTYAPYRFVDIYVRAALAESCALALYPWALWAFWRLAREPGRRRVAVAGLAYGLLLLSHNVTALLFTPLAMGAVVIGLVTAGHGRRPSAWLQAAGAGVLGVMLSAFSLLPSLLERGNIVQDQWTRATYSLTDHFVYVGQLLSPLWDYGYAVAGPEDAMSFQLGLAPLALALAGLALAGRTRAGRAVGLLFGGGLAAYVFLMVGASGPLWRAVTLLSLAQFPWRLLGVAALAAAGLSALAGAHLGRMRDKRALVVLALAIVAVGLPYARPQHTAPDPRSEQPVGTVLFELEYTDMRGMTAWTQEMPQDSPKVAAYLAGGTLPLAQSDVPGTVVETVHQGGHVQTVRVTAAAPGTLQFHTYYYPGWAVTVDGAPAAIRPEGPLGLITLDLPAGSHTVSIRFGETPLRRVANWITLLTAGGAALLAVPLRRYTHIRILNVKQQP